MKKTFTPFVTLVDGIFPSKMKAFLKILAERSGDKIGIMPNHKGTRTSKSILRAAGV